jgi:hypothetical protein
VLKLKLLFLFISEYEERLPSNDTILEEGHRLLEKYGYPWEMMPLMVAVLKYAKGDVDAASKKIDEGKSRMPGKNYPAIIFACTLHYIV